MSSLFCRKTILTYWPYAALWCLAAWQRTWTLWGVLQLFSLALMLWACADVALRAWSRGGLWRFVSVSLGTMPWITCCWLWAFHDTPMGPGVITMLITGTTMAFGYVASGFDSGLMVTLLGMLLLWFGVVRIVFKGSWPVCFGASALAFHMASIWLVLVAYEDLPLGSDSKSIATQDNVTHVVLEGQWDTARDLVIDANETTAFGAFMSSNRGTNKDREPGIARIDLAKGEVTGRYQSRMGDTVVLDETRGVVWFSDFLDGHVRALDIQSMQLKGPAFNISPWPDGVSRFGEQALVVRVETPRRGGPELFWINPEDSSQVGVDVEAHRWGNLNAAMESVPARSEVFMLQTGDDQTTLSAVRPAGVRQSKLMPGIIWEAAWDEKAQALWLGSMTEEAVFKVNPDTFDYETFSLPNGIREILPLSKGWVALADYLRAKVYLFDGRQIRKTIHVGRKPEAMALGPLTGALFVLSDAGLTRIDLTRILAEP